MTREVADSETAAGSLAGIKEGSTTAPLRVALFGCAPDTGNLGVSALCFSTLSGLARAHPGIDVTVFDHGRGHRWGCAWGGDQALSYSLCGGRYSRRLHEASSLWNIHRCVRWGGLGNPAAEAILASDAILDVSGGDSFTDLYGPHRFKTIVAPKKIALDAGRPLILLPQTYGPFKSHRSRQVASELVRRAEMAWARDRHSHEALKELLGSDYDPTRHRLGVDLAFSLSAAEPRGSLSPTVEEWLHPLRSRPVIGLNVSGLIYNDSRRSQTQYGFISKYPEIVGRLLDRLMRESDANILLIPHVVHPRGLVADNDYFACRTVLERLQAQGFGARVAQVQKGLNESQIKHVIGRLDWFCGTRMHSTIAALSSGVPAAAIAYSGKTLGVFESCGQGGTVADPRSLEGEAVVDLVWSAWRNRDRHRDGITERLPAVIEACQSQMQQIVERCQSVSQLRS